MLCDIRARPVPALFVVVRVWAALCFASLATGCAGLPAGWECSGTNEGCGSGQVCLSGELPGTTRCFDVCTTTPECASGESCVDEVCRPAQTECQSGADCLTPPVCQVVAGASCAAGTCIYEAKACDAPPANVCRDNGATFRSYQGSGTCDLGTGDCKYVYGDQTCVSCDPSLGCMLLSDGSPCTGALQCLSGNCADDVCCDGACDTLCVSCLMADTGGAADGICADVGVGLDPRNDCAGALACTGAGACFNKALGTACVDGPAECGSGLCADDVCCATACSGICERCAAGSGACQPVAAGNDPDDECAGALACDGARACFNKGLGASCVDGAAECGSGLCADDVCCATACSGICERCAAGSGACQPVANGADPDGECTGSLGCDGNGGTGAGACISGAGNGVACGVGGQCASGQCIDGVCCENACGGVCVACNVSLSGTASGQCASIPFFTDPEGECLNGVGCNGDGITPACNPQKAWGAAELIETTNSGDGAFPQVAVDGSGNAAAVWEQFDGTRNNIWANRYVSGFGWGTAELIETDNAGDALNPQVGLDPSGNAVAVWHQWDGARNNVWANRYVLGIGWGTAELIEHDDVSNANGQQIGLDASGNAIAVWFQFDGSRNNIQANRYVFGTGWGTPELIETDNAGTAVDPQVAVDPSGNAIAVWYQSDGTRNNVWANRYVPGAGWGTAELIETDSAGDAVYPQVALDPSGTAVAVWHQSDGTTENIWANRYVPGTGWGSSGLIETNDIGNARYPQVAVDPSGNAVAVWYQWDGVRLNIWANRYVPGTGWGTPELIETDNVSNANGQQVAVDLNGNAVAVWYQYDGTRNNIWTNRYVPGLGWGTAELIETDNAGTAVDPQVAVDASGNAIAVWSQSDAARINIWANRFE